VDLAQEFDAWETRSTLWLPLQFTRAHPCSSGSHSSYDVGPGNPFIGLRLRSVPCPMWQADVSCITGERRLLARVALVVWAALVGEPVRPVTFEDCF